MSLISCKNLSKTYGAGEAQVQALREVNLDIERNEFVVIEGASGSGKSTLLQLMGGLDTPTSGQVIADDKDINAMNETERSIFRRQHYGFVFQSFHLLPVLTARENIILPLLLDGAKVDESWFGQLVESLKIDDRLSHMPSQLSGGQQQRVAIARAMIARPQILFADEPTGNLDKATGQDVLNLLTQTSMDAGSTLIIITHDPDVAKRAGRRLALSDGALAMEAAL